MNSLVKYYRYTAAGRARSGCGSAILGSTQKVVSELKTYQKIGLRSFILSGHPHHDGCKHFGTSVLIHMKASSLRPRPAKNPNDATWCRSLRMMDRIDLNTNLNFSQIIYGMWRLSEDVNTSVEHVRNKISACLDQGITTFDQADIYGGYEAEAVLGNALKGSGLRDKIEIVTKCDIVAPVGRYSDARIKYYDTSREHLFASVDHSLRLMGIDHIDLLLIHRPDPFMDHNETGSALDTLVQSGKVRGVGVSNFKPHDWELLQSGMKNKLCTNQIELSVLAHESFTNGDVAFHQRLATPLMAWSPLAGGELFSEANRNLYSLLSKIGAEQNVDATALAIAWLLAHPSQILPVLGTNSLARIKTMSQACEVILDRQTWFEIYTSVLGQEVA